jgi:hypothetical protein
MNRLVLGTLITLATGFWPMPAQDASTVPQEIRQVMKKGRKLDLVWKDPKFDTGTGFTLGQIRTQAEGYYANTIDYFPVPLARMAIPGSTNILNLVVTDLAVKDSFTTGQSSAIMTVEGTIVDKDGKPLFAFISRDEVDTRESPTMNCKGVMDKIAWNLAKDLGQPFADAVAQRNAVSDKATSASGLPMLPPKSQGQQLTVGERLIQLDNLRKNGLITTEEYDKKKAEILKGL